jgi:hypothetical protein
MRNYFSLINVTALALLSLSVQAQPIDKNSAPKKVMEQFYKRHPNALDVGVALDKHFNQELIEVFFKENKEEKENHIEIYRSNGHFFVNAVQIEASKNSTQIPAVANDNLKAVFPNYDINEAVLIPNPNGTGEEFDLLVNNDNKLWHVVIDRKGNIATKETVN